MRAKEGTDLWLRHLKLELERAVIEAAKELYYARQDAEQYEVEWEALRALERAVEALLHEEAERA
jgi:hypothetical protein